MYLLATVLASPTFACPGHAVASAAEPECAEPLDGSAGEPRRTASTADPGRSARQPVLVGDACSWTTSMMAQRVLEQGTPWTYVGRLSASTNGLPSKVASPYTVGPEQRIHVVANEVLEQVLRGPAAAAGEARVELTGRVLEVDGITYFVATALAPAAS